MQKRCYEGVRSQFRIFAAKLENQHESPSIEQDHRSKKSFRFLRTNCDGGQYEHMATNVLEISQPNRVAILPEMLRANCNDFVFYSAYLVGAVAVG